MKEIEGKIKFGIVPIFDSIIPNTEGHIIIGELSLIAEEQAAKFVEYYKTEGVYRNYIGSLDEAWDCATAQESLISLLKANDVWIKEWKEEPKLWGELRDCRYAEEKEEYNKLPDDLLLIKL